MSAADAISVVLLTFSMPRWNSSRGTLGSQLKSVVVLICAKAQIDEHRSKSRMGTSFDCVLHRSVSVAPDVDSSNLESTVM